jgi:succinoglycan biosynthesis protein ExoM
MRSVVAPANSERPSPGTSCAGVCIAIPTYRRAHLLAKLLGGIARQRLPETPPDVEVVVLDNDPEKSAEQTVAAWRTTFPFPLHYRSIPQAGLSVVRNHALRAARGRTYLAMIDDDEVPEPQWLAELLRVGRATNADAVIGPVPPLLPRDAPRWLSQARTAEFPMRGDGALIDDGWSGNCLLRSEAILTLKLSFDGEFNFSGGEDQLFFRQLRARGGTIAYAPAARAWEFAPPERRTVGFLLRRSFRRGNSLAKCDRRVYGTAQNSALRALKGALLSARGLLGLAPATLVRGTTGLVGAGCDVAAGLGMLAGLFGVTYQAYRRKPTREVHDV